MKKDLSLGFILQT